MDSTRDASLERRSRTILGHSGENRQWAWRRFFCAAFFCGLYFLTSQGTFAQLSDSDEQILAIHLQEFVELTKQSRRFRAAHKIASDIHVFSAKYSQDTSAYLIIPNVLEGDESYNLRKEEAVANETSPTTDQERTITEHILADHQPFLILEKFCSDHPTERYVIPYPLDDPREIFVLHQALQSLPESARDAFVLTDREMFNLRVALHIGGDVSNTDRLQVRRFLSDRKYRWFFRSADEGLPLVFLRVDLQGTQILDDGPQSSTVTVLHAEGAGTRRTLPNLVINGGDLETIRNIIRLGRSRSRKVAVDVDIKEVGFRTDPSDLEHVRNALRISFTDHQVTEEYCSLENPTSPDIFSNRLTFLGECREEVAEFPTIHAILRSDEYQLVGISERDGTFILEQSLPISEGSLDMESLSPLTRLTLPVYISKLTLPDRIDSENLFRYKIDLGGLNLSESIEEVAAVVKLHSKGDWMHDDLSDFFDDPSELALRAESKKEIILGLGAKDLRIIANEAEQFNEILDNLWRHIKVASELVRQVDVDVIRWSGSRRGSKEDEDYERRFKYVYSYLLVKASRFRNLVTDRDRLPIDIRVLERISPESPADYKQSIAIEIDRRGGGAYDTESWQ